MEAAAALPPGIVKFGDTPWAMATIARTVEPDDLGQYAELGYTCVFCAYYNIKVNGWADRLPQLWEFQKHVGSRQHQKCRNNAVAPLDAMTQWLEEHQMNPPPRGGAAQAGLAPAGPSTAESPAASGSAAASTPPSFHEHQRLQELEDAVAALRTICNDLQQRNEALQISMQEQNAAMRRRMEEESAALQTRMQEMAREHGGGWQWRFA